MGILRVKLVKINNLTNADGFCQGKSDPYVKFHLEQDNIIFDRGYGKKQSSKKSNTLNPEYHEIFEFNDVPSMNNMILHIQVLDDDFGKDDILGSTQLNLERINITSAPTAIEAVIDKKAPKISICNPFQYLCYCCCSCCYAKDAVIFLEITFKDT